MQLPSIGRIVVYRNRDGNYDLPAIVTCTQESHWREGEANWPQTPFHVHLHVFTPGEQGSYQELDVPPATQEQVLDGTVPPRTWRWPDIRSPVNV